MELVEKKLISGSEFKADTLFAALLKKRAEEEGLNKKG
jgi:hypothetical protein